MRSDDGDWGAKPPLTSPNKELGRLPLKTMIDGRVEITFEPSRPRHERAPQNISPDVAPSMPFRGRLSQ